MQQALRKYPEARIMFMHFTQPFMVVLQISLAAGLIVAAPLVTMEMWAFIAPALTREEKKPIKYVAPIGIVLFAMGVSLAYWVARYTVGWFLGFVSYFPQAVLYQDPKAYVLFMLKLMAVFGAIFQLPVILMFLAWVGIMRSSWMKKYWRHAIVGISVAGLMVAPSNDTLTIFVMIGPVVVLYGLSIFLVQLIERKRDRRKT
jgi:sec-independent protein translocase protein TatC